MKRLHLLAILIAVLLIGLTPVYGQGMSAALHVEGVTLRRVNGDRFVFAGANVEMFRDYRLGQGMSAACNYASDGFYPVRKDMAARLKGLGVNAIRLNYAYKNLDATNTAKFLDVAQAFIEAGLYVMPSDHTYTGGVLTQASASYPKMREIVAGLRTRGVNLDYLIMNPFNEPGPSISAADWVLAQQKVINDLRTNSQFDGLIVLDGTGWATLIDVDRFNGLIKYDADLRTSLARAADPDAAPVAGNLMFSNHLYPNIVLSGLPAQITANSGKVPLTTGELGQYNETPLGPDYVRSVITLAIDKWIPAGHNGLWSWIVNWCDDNKQLDDWQKNPAVPYSIDEPFTSYGNIWNTAYFARFKDSSTPIPPTRGPTLATNTPRPSNTPTPRPVTNTPSSPTRTQPPPPTPTASGPTATPCPREYHLVGTFGGQAIDIWLERCA